MRRLTQEGRMRPPEESGNAGAALTWDDLPADPTGRSLRYLLQERGPQG
ncbi:MAG: hypothetical protein RH859_09600 [Longimicrobiales bacterium]